MRSLKGDDVLLGWEFESSQPAKPIDDFPLSKRFHSLRHIELNQASLQSREVLLELLEAVWKGVSGLAAEEREKGSRGC